MSSGSCCNTLFPTSWPLTCSVALVVASFLSVPTCVCYCRSPPESIHVYSCRHLGQLSIYLVGRVQDLSPIASGGSIICGVVSLSPIFLACSRRPSTWEVACSLIRRLCRMERVASFFVCGRRWRSLVCAVLRGKLQRGGVHSSISLQAGRRSNSCRMAWRIAPLTGVFVCNWQVVAIALFQPSFRHCRHCCPTESSGREVRWTTYSRCPRSSGFLSFRLVCPFPCCVHAAFGSSGIWYQRHPVSSEDNSLMRIWGHAAFSVPSRAHLRIVCLVGTDSCPLRSLGCYDVVLGEVGDRDIMVAGASPQGNNSKS